MISEKKGWYQALVWVIIAAIIAVLLIADGLGIDFWIVVLALGVIFLLACFLVPNDKDSKEKAKRKKTALKVILIGAGVAAVIGIIASIAGSVESSSSSPADSEYDNMMAGQDWGDDHYYDRHDNVVKKKPW